MSKWLLDQLRASKGASQQLAPIHSKPLSPDSNFAVTGAVWENVTTITTLLDVPEASFCMIYKKTGALAVSVAGVGLTSIVPPDSMCLMHAGHYRLLESKGVHSSMFLTPTDPAPMHLRDLLIRTRRLVTTRSVRLGMQWHASEVERLYSITTTPNYFESVALVYGTMAHFEANSSGLDFAPLPSTSNAVIQKVCDGVRSSYQADWNNFTGSELAGYSQYHFSRTFKQVMHCGFPEYVERVRLSIALALLVSGAEALDTVPLKAGFASPGAFRDALRTYVGFTPSDIKGLCAGAAHAHEVLARRYSEMNAPRRKPNP